MAANLFSPQFLENTTPSRSRFQPTADRQIVRRDTSGLSNTVRISYRDGDSPTVTSEAAEELAQFGHVARLDVSLSTLLGSILVTYFDVRCAQRVLMEVSLTAPFPPASHDFRIVRINVASYLEQAGSLPSFSQYGEVACASVVAGDALVEFYDMRSAQLLLAAVGSSGSPWNPSCTEQAIPPNMPASCPQMASPMMGYPGATPGGIGGFGFGSFEKFGFETGRLTIPGGRGTDSESSGSNSFTNGGSSKSRDSYRQFVSVAPVLAGPGQADAGQSPARGGDKSKKIEQAHRPVRTKVTIHDFSKYDIDSEKIANGQDLRTTVMVRNLTGSSARKDFLNFLEACGLHEKYMFFYMPCKEHRNVPSGFAFVNFSSPKDVLALFIMAKSGVWRRVVSDPHAKEPAVSYARFQGQEELLRHFNSSVVLREQDPEKRPIFRSTEGGRLQEITAPKMWAKLAPTKKGPKRVPEAQEGVHGYRTAAEDADIKGALYRGAREIAAILSGDAPLQSKREGVSESSDSSDMMGA
eukprot:CAMPEP_0170621704 /NCGR_PEP_ID=MMETSP0224-20130122/28741_1 /TAXON_ID=285029 /ORGANISM="Togula jolla, Strain CCCM 725" /LENGTH=524 /DNA_ID=CAMNT_0010947977 /DNA_START=99 /DNA_END=1673 /DNA_ORIENTATION=-